MPLFYFAMELLFRLGVGGRLGFGSGSLCGGFLGRSRSFLDRGFLSRSFLCGNLFCRSFRDFLDRLGDLFLRVDNSDTVVYGVPFTTVRVRMLMSQPSNISTGSRSSSSSSFSGLMVIISNSTRESPRFPSRRPTLKQNIPLSYYFSIVQNLAKTTIII